MLQRLLLLGGCVQHTHATGEVPGGSSTSSSSLHQVWPVVELCRAIAAQDTPHRIHYRCFVTLACATGRPAQQLQLQAGASSTVTASAQEHCTNRCARVSSNCGVPCGTSVGECARMHSPVGGLPQGDTNRVEAPTGGPAQAAPRRVPHCCPNPQHAYLCLM